MPKVVIVEDLIYNAINAKQVLLRSSDNSLQAGDIVLIEVNAGDQEKTIKKDDVSSIQYLSMGISQVLEYIRDEEIDVFITDLGLEGTYTSAQQIINKSRHDLKRWLGEVPNLIGGCLLLSEFFLHHPDSYAIPMSDHVHPRASRILEFLQTYESRVFWSNAADKVDDATYFTNRILNDSLLESKLWPPDTENWFHDPNDEMPHNPPQMCEQLDAVKNRLRKYLSGVLGIDPPEAWFDDKQFEWLYQDLKYLTGSTSIFQGGSRTLTLGNIAIAFVATTGMNRKEFKESFAETISWSKSVACKEILPKTQTKEQAIEAFASLFHPRNGLFSKLEYNNNNQNEPLVNDSWLNSGEFGIEYGFDYSKREKDSKRLSLLEKIKSNHMHEQKLSGDVYESYLRMVQAFSCSFRGWEPAHIFQLYCEGDKTFLKLFSL